MMILINSNSLIKTKTIDLKIGTLILQGGVDDVWFNTETEE